MSPEKVPLLRHGPAGESRHPPDDDSGWFTRRVGINDVNDPFLRQLRGEGHADLIRDEKSPVSPWGTPQAPQTFS